MMTYTFAADKIKILQDEVSDLKTRIEQLEANSEALLNLLAARDRVDQSKTSTS